MKKFIAILLALIVVFSSAVVAFAVDVYTCPTCSRKFDSIEKYNEHIATHEETEADNGETIYECPVCHKKYKDVSEYNECVDSHYNDINYHYDHYVNLTIPELLSSFVDIFNNTGIMAIVTNIFEKAYTLFTSYLETA